ncbi:glycosyltransferase family 2 protein [Pararhodobacter sp. SW119]|uniref:glycosyltransferase n=1 Tax=Pararhodobacter sp. SW119 TaxID=2780075 RepID=UPI001ADF766F
MNARQSAQPVLRRVASSGAGTPWEAAVIIPARNESKRIEACLHALADAIAQAGRTVGVIVCVNDTIDDTAVRAAAVLRARALPNIVLDLYFAPGTGGVGRVRDLGMKLSQRIPQPPKMLMTTDADSRADPAWIAANLTELRDAHVVFGTIIPDAEELAQIRPLLPRYSLAEEEYARAAVRLVNRLDPLPHDPLPSHRNRSGASIALTTEALGRLGGIPWQPLSEDRALALRAEALDLRVRHASAPQVVTSCRLQGRAEGGMATTLRVRCSQDDPFCDDWLEPAEALARRYRTKGRLRALWPAPSPVWWLARELLGPAPGLQPVPRPDRFKTFGAFWQNLEAIHPALRRHPLRQSHAARELPLLLAQLRDSERTGLQKPVDRSQRETDHAPALQ